MPARPESKDTGGTGRMEAGKIALTLAVGACGGMLLGKRHVPGGYLVGSMIFVAALSIATGLASIPSSLKLLTQIIIQVPFLVGGSVAIEKIFGWPGIGSLMVTSISSRDYNTILGIAVVICIAVLAANILLDILYSCLDPRITYDE